LFGFSRAMDVVPVSLVGGLLTFRTGAALRVGKSSKIRLVHPSAPTLNETFSITTVSCHPEEETFLCSGALQEDEETLAGVTQALAMAGVEGACRRASRRLSAVIRILSRELPNFRAVTRDVSQTGALLVCDGPVAEGTYLNLKMDLEVVGVSELTMQGQCVRCVEHGDGRRVKEFRLGVAFTRQHPQTQAVWDRFYEHLLKNEGASVLARTLDGGPASTSGRVRTIEQPSAPAAQAPAAQAYPAASSGYGVAQNGHGQGYAAAQGSPPNGGSFPSAPAAWGAFAGQAPPGPSSNGGSYVAAQATPVVPSQPRQVAQPPLVEAVGIRGAGLVFRARQDPAYVAGRTGQITLPLWYQGQWTQVVLQVALLRVDAAPNGVCVCWSNILEDNHKLQVLSQLLPPLA
jgi:hypothetical protein